MNITIISVGKIKEKYFVKAIDHYKKEINKFIKLILIEVADEKAPERLSDKDMEIVKFKEGERILSKIKEGQYVITLEIDGKKRTSEKFKNELTKLNKREINDIVFIIGGSLGLHKKVVERKNDSMSFSKMTFPHQLMKVILMEQVLRTKI